MGMIGRWIDSLNDDDRDAIIRHPDPTFRGDTWMMPTEGGERCGCLVGTVCLNRTDGAVWIPYFDKVPGLDPDRAMTWGDVGSRFPWVTQRFGPERVWRAVKARAARANHVTLPEPVEDATPEPSHA